MYDISATFWTWEMSKDLKNHIAELELVETTDPDNEKPVYRRPGFDGIATFGELDNKLGEALRRCRQEEGLSRAEIARLVGLSEQVYGRYERNSSKMTVSRLIHLSEVLGASPLSMLFSTAPHLWGKTEVEAESRFRIMKLLEDLPAETMASVTTLLETIAVLQAKANKT
ncbi:helix-turn-helix transcriptional regulator (plasmid) [Phyllobacterium sp. A18/5-2]|uniref:helix-turn-helix domain-containing protein n=1 Tax=Phyllobacterium sp. A18/5-2 TaxID=2978392 RepID=UPI0021C7B79E|nr:helix-turn-helix transcriptional regulator [Phyllobacterium sp. A18/5-2]UXN66207.1 helix-turn-helix transcriptional regulator [Phyllobacterium sp. A18/5-2]